MGKTTRFPKQLLKFEIDFFVAAFDGSGGRRRSRQTRPRQEFERRRAVEKRPANVRERSVRNDAANEIALLRKAPNPKRLRRVGRERARVEIGEVREIVDAKPSGERLRVGGVEPNRADDVKRFAGREFRGESVQIDAKIDVRNGRFVSASATRLRFGTPILERHSEENVVPETDQEAAFVEDDGDIAYAE